MEDLPSEGREKEALHLGSSHGKARSHCLYLFFKILMQI